MAGVRATIDGRFFAFHARRGVVLAAGDYANNPALIAEFKGERFAAIEGINPFARGDGALASPPSRCAAREHGDHLRAGTAVRACQQAAVPTGAAIERPAREAHRPARPA